MVTLNRTAIVVIPKQPFLDWLRATDPTSYEFTLQELGQEPTVYLIPECDTAQDVEEAMRQVYAEIFDEQLGGWYNDPASWPNDRSFDVFCRWFSYQHHSMVADLSEDPLLYEED